MMDWMEFDIFWLRPSKSAREILRTVKRATACFPMSNRKIVRDKVSYFSLENKEVVASLTPMEKFLVDCEMYGVDFGLQELRNKRND